MGKLDEDVEDFNQFTNAKTEISSELSESEINVYKKKMALFSIGIFGTLIFHWGAYFWGTFKIWSPVAVLAIFTLITLITHAWHKAVKNGFKKRHETQNILEINKQCFYLGLLLLVFAYAFRQF